MTARVVGVGQPAAGDDVAGIEVVRRLRRGGGLPRGVELIETTDPTALFGLLEPPAPPLIVVDAVTDGGPPGRVLRLSARDLEDPGRVRPVSGHSLDVGRVIATARALDPAAPEPDVTIVGVTVRPPCRPGDPLSREVDAAIDDAVRAVLALIEELPCTRAP